MCGCLCVWVLLHRFCQLLEEKMKADVAADASGSGRMQFPQFVEQQFHSRCVQYARLYSFALLLTTRLRCRCDVPPAASALARGCASFGRCSTVTR